MLKFEVKNNVEATPEPSAETSGIGLSNVKRQLELLYPKHTFESFRNNGTVTTLIAFNWNDKTAMPDR